MQHGLLKEYFDDLTSDLIKDSERIRRFFASHAPSAGANREDITARFLRKHINPLIGVDVGMILSSHGDFSNQPDIVLVDRQTNLPIHSDKALPLWLIESTYGIFEVKTQLTPTTLADAAAKCQRYKELHRSFDDSFGRQAISDSLFCLWSFECPKDLKSVKKNISQSLKGIPHRSWPDFIIVPGRFLWIGGGYFNISSNGMPGSPYYNKRLSEVGGNPEKLLEPPLKMLDLGDNTISAFVYWINSWLLAAGPRRPNQLDYIGLETWGHEV